MDAELYRAFTDSQALRNDGLHSPMSAPIKSCSDGDRQNREACRRKYLPGRSLLARELKTREDWNEWRQCLRRGHPDLAEIDLPLGTMPEAETRQL